MSGLYQRAQAFLSRARDLPAEGEFTFDEESGISREEQKEVLAEIEKVTAESRISVSPELFKIHALKRGIFLPFTIMAFSLLLLGGGTFFFYSLFQRGETSLMQEGVAITTTEGTLIKELKKESEAKLLEKNKEISQIQSSLEEIKQEREDLQANMESKIEERELQLREALSAELEEERQRLKDQGISEEDITRQLRELESQKSVEYQQQLDTYKREAEEERRRIEENLETLQKEYNANLALVEQERKAVLEESREREAELRSQLAEKTEALEAEKLQAAEELRRLSAQREEEELASTQLIGFYNSVQRSIQNGELEQALLNLKGIRDYLNTEGVVALSGMFERRQVEFFVVDSITNLVQGEMKKETVDTRSLIASAEILTDIRRRVASADELRRSGRIDEAGVLYQEALDLVPEIGKSHTFFLDQQEAAEQARQRRFRNYLLRAETAFRGKDYPATLEHYADALEYLPEDSENIEQIINQVRQAGFELGLGSLIRRDSSEAVTLLATADNLLARVQYDQAILAYIDVIGKYPYSTRLPAGLEGISRAVEAKNRLAQESEISWQDSLAEVQTSLDERTGERDTLQTSFDERTAERDTLQTNLDKTTAEREATQASLDEATAERDDIQKSMEERTTELEENLKGRLAEIKSLQQEKQVLAGEIDSLKQDIDALKESGATASADAAGRTTEQAAELQRKIDRLETIESNYYSILDSYNNYVGIKENYQDYTEKEDSLISSLGKDQALMESKLHLNSFLASTEETFPGLWERIKRYDEAFEQAGRDGMLQNMNDIVFELSLRDRDESKVLFLETEKLLRKDDEMMGRFLDDIKILFE